MRFLCNKKIKLLAFFVAVFFSGLFLNNNTYAADPATFVANDGVTWLYTYSGNTLEIGFADLPSNASKTSVKVPGLSEISTILGDASINELETYYVNDIRTLKYDATYAPANLQTVDMTDTSKVQMKSLTPLFDKAEGTVELIFGENMVIKNYYDDSKTSISENTSTYRNKGLFESVQATLRLTNLQNVKYVGFRTFYGVTLAEDSRDITIYNGQKYGQEVFAHSNIKSLTVHSVDLPAYVCDGSENLTSLTIGDEVKIIHGYAFQNTTALSQDINTNNVEQIYSHAFYGSAITGVTFGDPLTVIRDFAFSHTSSISKPLNTNNVYGFDVEAFSYSSVPELITSENTKAFGSMSFYYASSLGSLDFSGRSPVIGVMAFEHAGITELDLGNIVSIEYHAFAYNSLEEVYIPKSFRGAPVGGGSSSPTVYPFSAAESVSTRSNNGYIGSMMFTGNNIKKLTTAFDTTTVSTGTPLSYSFDVRDTVEELIVLAPYSENETPSQFHNKGTAINYEESMNGTSYLAPIVSEAKNIVTPFAFLDYKKLKKITIGEGYEVLGKFSFGKGSDGGHCISGETCNLVELNLPSTLRAIGSFAFFSTLENNQLVVDSLPENLEYIGKSAFDTQLSPEHFTLTNFDLPKLKFLGQGAFYKSNVKNVVLHNSIQCFWNDSFMYDYELENITIDFDIWNNSVSYALSAFTNVIGDYTKGGYESASKKIKSITFTENATTPIRGAYVGPIGGQFTGIKAETIDLSATNWTTLPFNVFTEAEIGTIKLPHALETIERGVFADATIKNELVLPNTLTTLGEGVFYNANVNIQTLPESITSIGTAAFYGAHHEVTDQETGETTELGLGFDTLPSSLTTIGEATFMDSVFLHDLTLSGNLETIGKSAFQEADFPIELIPESVKTIGEGAFYGTQNLALSKLPEGLENIGRYAFQGSSLTIDSLPDSIIYIGDGAFYGAEGVTADVDLPNLVTLEDSAFHGTNVRDVTLHDSIELLGKNVFYGVSTLRNITIDMDLYSVDRTTEAYGEESIQYDDYLYTAPAFTSSKKVAVTPIIEERLAERIEHRVSTKTTEMLAAERARKGRELRDWEIEDVTEAAHDAAYKEVLDEIYAEVDAEYDYNADFYTSFVATFGDKSKLGEVTFTARAGEPCGGFANCPAELAYFFGIEAEKVDLSATNWTTTSHSMFQEANADQVILPSNLQTIGQDSFYEATPGNIDLPATLVTIDEEGFQWANTNINGLPEGLKVINRSGFYGADVTDDLVIPAGIETIGKDAFNAGDEDVYYDTITLMGDLDYEKTSDQPIFVVFYGAEVNKLIIHSTDLPTLHANDGISEFHGMAVTEAKITALPKISDYAFEECLDLVRVDLTEDDDLRAIGNKAFVDAESLDQILFADSLKDEVVTIGQNAFQGTAFRTIGDQYSDIDLTAAKFDASASLAFANMPKVTSVKVPRTFSGATIPEATFYNNAELTTADIDYKITEMGKGAFTDDNKLKSIFIWGNTEIKDDNITGERTRGVNYGPTIPATTDIYAYSVSPAENFAGDSSRDEFEGVFYPLDEVIVITSNKPTLVVNEGQDDFDKTDLIVYALRRDGMVLESDEWGVYSNIAKPRSEYPDVNFEHLSDLTNDQPVFAAIHDTPVPQDELDFGNENFENIGFVLVPDEDHEGILKVVLKYTDAYTNFPSDTDLLGDEPTCEDLGTCTCEDYGNCTCEDYGNCTCEDYGNCTCEDYGTCTCKDRGDCTCEDLGTCTCKDRGDCTCEDLGTCTCEDYGTCTCKDRGDCTCEDLGNCEVPEIAVPNTGWNKFTNAFLTTGLPLSTIIVTIATGGYFLFQYGKKHKFNSNGKPGKE